MGKESIIHFVIQQKLWDKSRMGNMRIKKAIEIIRMFYHVNKRFTIVLIKELENLNLIKRLDRHNLIIHPCKFNWDNTSEVYNNVGLC